LITLAVTSFIWKTRPELIYDAPQSAIKQTELDNF
jgi:cobalt/nickel transport system permease protein